MRLPPLILLLITILSGCYTAPPLTDEQIANASDPVLCTWRAYQYEERLDNEIHRRGADCSPTALYCAAKRIKKGTEQYVSCAKTFNLAQKRSNNPDWAYCTDKGFKTGTSGMATCMASWHQQQQNAEILEWQKKQAADQYYQTQMIIQNSQRQNAPVHCTTTGVGNTLSTNCY